jgi:hypothetical protein
VAKTKINIKLPGYVPVYKFMSLRALSAMEILCWLATDDDSPLAARIQEFLPEDKRNEMIDAVAQVGVVFQEHRAKKEESGEQEAKAL